MKRFGIFCGICYLIVYFLPVHGATVLVTHGLGSDSASFYTTSSYMTLLERGAESLGHNLKSVSWTPTGLSTKYAGLLQQDRIAGAVTIAKAILDERAKGNAIILIGHGYGGQVMCAACRLLNPENKSCGDSFIYDLVHTVKVILAECTKEPELRTLDPLVIISFAMTGLKITQAVVYAIEQAHVIDQTLITFIKQQVTLESIREIKRAWDKAFFEVHTYSQKLFQDKLDHTNVIDRLYMIGTTFNGQKDSVFSPDMRVIKSCVNFYSSNDLVLPAIGKRVLPVHERIANCSVEFDGHAPFHKDFCGNKILAPVLLLIPDYLQKNKIGGFEQWVWGKPVSLFFDKDGVKYKGVVP